MNDIFEGLKPHVYSWFDPPECPGEENSGEVVVQREGYIPAHVEIEEMILAGERLNETRAEYEFSADEEVPDNYIDPFRSPFADIVDLDNAVGTLAFMMKKDKEAADKKVAEEKEIADKAAAEKAKADFDEAVTKEAKRISGKEV